ncbi:hypothetical protein [Microbulbifer litoralis]|nr:hypothetical protein [Microbulbifer sp. GX H0434]
MIHSILNALAPLWLPAALTAQYQTNDLLGQLLREKRQEERQNGGPPA